MIIISVYYFLQLISLYGFGVLFSKLIRHDTESIGEIGILGIIFATILSSIWSLFAPVGSIAWLIYVLGLITTLLNHPRLNKLAVSIVLFLAILFPIYISVPQYDTGLYHLSQIIWEREHVLPLGLANFHSRYGFNSLWLTYAAGMGIGNEWVVTSFLVNASLFYFVFHFIWDKVLQYRKSFLSQILLFFLLYLGAQIYHPSNLGGPSTDYPSQFFGIFGAYYFLCFFETKKRILLDKSIMFVIFSAIYKFSNVGIVIIPVMYGLFYYKYHLYKSRIVVLSIIMLILWIARNILISGCIVSLVESSCLPLTWSAKTQSAQVASWVMSWARNRGVPPELVLSNYSWLLDYWIATMWEIPIIKLFVILLLSVLTSITIKYKTSLKYILKLKWFLLTLLVFFIVWFIGAPDYRFASLYFVFLVSMMLAYLFRSLINTMNTLIHPSLWLLIILLFNVSIYRVIKFNNRLGDQWPRYNTPDSRLMLINNLDMEIRTLKSGDQCFDVMYCTPEYSDNIRIEKKWGRLFISRE